jgi:hypothetical protein
VPPASASLTQIGGIVGCLCNFNLRCILLLMPVNRSALQ